MEDDKLKELFSNFNPELSSDFNFMSRLQQNLNSVELIKQRNAELKSKNKKAVMIAALVGFLVGMLFSFTIPYLTNAMANLQTSLLPNIASLNIIFDNKLAIAWILIAGTSVITAVNAYDLSLSLLSKPDMK